MVWLLDLTSRIMMSAMFLGYLVFPAEGYPNTFSKSEVFISIHGLWIWLDILCDAVSAFIHGQHLIECKYCLYLSYGNSFTAKTNIDWYFIWQWMGKWVFYSTAIFDLSLNLDYKIILQHIVYICQTENCT